MRFRVRTDPREDAGADGEILLDWFEDDRAGSTVWYDAPQHPFLKRLVPSPVAMDLLRLGGAVFCADKIALREHAPDAWTRELTLTLPVSDPNLWSTAAALVENTLGSLSGDRWSTTFILGRPRLAGRSYRAARGRADADSRRPSRQPVHGPHSDRAVQTAGRAVRGRAGDATPAAAASRAEEQSPGASVAG